jgi:putative CocE/NonD family hydrolase
MTYPVKVVRNVRISMADGVTLAADLHLPEVPGQRFPALIEYTPYHKNNNWAYGPRASRYPYFASHGYVFVNVDIRGTGDSEGYNTSPSSPEEQRDGLDVIRWCAAQPWCDGNVGMIGISYTAGVCYDAARAAPPELKAIILCQMCSDWYDGVLCPGGSPRPFIWENYAPLMAAYNFAPPDPDLVGSHWSETWQQRLDHSVPWGNAYLEQLLDGPYWESRLLRGHEEKVRAATFLIGGWCDSYPDDFLRVYARLRCPKRILIGPWTHNYPENAWPLPRVNDRHECLRWFDRHLKGIATEPEPPVILFQREFTRPEALRREDNGRFIAMDDWPPRDVQPYQIPLDSVGTCQLAYRADAGIAAGRYAIGQMLPGWGMSDDQKLDEPFARVFTDSRLTADGPVELLGAPVAHLSLSSTAEIAFVSLKLCDEAPDYTSVLVTKGMLNLTHRNGHGAPEPLVPGKVYTVQVPLQAIAYRFRQGHRLRLMVAAADFQNAWPTPLPHTLSIHAPSRLELPLAGAIQAEQTPSFLPSDFPPLPPEQIPTPDYSITRDLIRNAVTVDIRTLSGIATNRSSFTVHVSRPADAVVQSEYEYPLERPGLSIRVRSQCTTRSDAQAFHHLTEVEITVNGRQHWRKSWSVSVPRVGC